MICHALDRAVHHGRKPEEHAHERTAAGQNGAGHRRDEQYRTGDRRRVRRRGGARDRQRPRRQRGAAVLDEIASGRRAGAVRGGRSRRLGGRLAQAGCRRDRRARRPASTCSSTTPASSRAPRPPATDEASFDEVYAVNVKAPFFLTAAIAPADGRSRRRGDHQPRVVGRPARHPRRCRCTLDQRRDGDADPGLGGRVRAGGRARQRDLPGRGADPGAAAPTGADDPAEVMMRGTPAGTAGTAATRSRQPPSTWPATRRGSSTAP